MTPWEFFYKRLVYDFQFFEGQKVEYCVPHEQPCPVPKMLGLDPQIFLVGAKQDAAQRVVSVPFTMDTQGHLSRTLKVDR